MPHNHFLSNKPGTSAQAHNRPVRTLILLVQQLIIKMEK